MINLFHPFISEESKRSVQHVLDGKNIAQGVLVDSLETEWEWKYGTKYNVAVNSGTSALHLAYILAGIQEDDEVITPVLTCTATNIPLLYLKAKPVFADIDPTSLTIDPKDVEAKITKKTKAIVFVHFGGNNKNLAEIMLLANKYNLKVIEDAAQAIIPQKFGLADYTCVSFQAIKTLTAGDGGMLIVKNNADYEKAKRLRWFGIDRPRKQVEGDVDVWEIGYKYHMNDISAAILLGNLHEVDELIAHRKMILDGYSKGIPIIPNTIWLAITFVKNSKETSEKLLKLGVETGMHHYRNDKYSIFKKFAGYYPNMDSVDNKYLLLPLHSKVEKEDVHKICEKLRQVQ